MQFFCFQQWWKIIRFLPDRSPLPPLPTSDPFPLIRLYSIKFVGYRFPKAIICFPKKASFSPTFHFTRKFRYLSLYSFLLISIWKLWFYLSTLRVFLLIPPPAIQSNYRIRSDKHLKKRSPPRERKFRLIWLQVEGEDTFIFRRNFFTKGRLEVRLTFFIFIIFQTFFL